MIFYKFSIFKFTIIDVDKLLQADELAFIEVVFVFDDSNFVFVSI
jgi:hypothetical protein